MKQYLLIPATIALCCGILSAQERAGCTDAMLQGTYATTLTGTAPAQSVAPGSAALPGTIQTFLGLVLSTFDGKGNFTQVDFIKGTLSGFGGPRAGRGTYKVNPDCSATITVQVPVAPFEIISQVILIEGGRRTIGIVASPLTNMTTLSGTRIN